MTDSSYKARDNGERPVQKEDDPLMQLSQIGGFEDLFKAQSTHQDTTPSDDMFAIDLERELVGSLDDDFFIEDAADVLTSPVEESFPVEQAFNETVQPDSSAADQYRDSYRSASARSYASYNQGSHGYGSLTQHLASQQTSQTAEPAEAAEPEFEPMMAELEQGLEEPAAQTHSYQQDDAFVASLEDELAFALGSDDGSLPLQTESDGAYEPQYVAEPQYHAPQPAVPALSLEDELENLLFGDQNAAAPEAPVYDYAEQEPFFEAQNSDELTSTDGYEENIDDFAAQSSIEGGTYQPAFSQPVYDEPDDLQEPAFEPIAPVVHSHDQPPQDMLFDDTSFGVEASDIELDALNQASAEFEATLGDLPADDDFQIDDENFSEAIERELSSQNYFAWEKDKVEPETEQSAEFAADAETDNFFSDQDFDFGFEEPVAKESSGKSGDPLTFAHAIAEDERKVEPLSHYSAHHSSYAVPAPDVATLSVSEAKVEQTQPLDLPEVPYYDETENAGLNQLEAEFAEVFSAINVDDKPVVQDEAASADRAFDDIFRESYSEFSPSSAQLAAGGIAAVGAGAGLAALRHADGTKPSSVGNQDDFYNHWASGDAGGDSGGNKGVKTAEPYGLGEDLGASAAAYRERPVRGRRGMLLATAAGVLVLIGGIAYHFIGGGVNSDEPVIIRSDNQPVKVQPENPGGATVPNQDKAVYERVAGTIPQNPEQKSLVTAQEDPVDLATTEDEFGSIDEERNDTITAANNDAVAEEAPLIVPRTVQTMVVRADGTIVPQAAEPRPVTPVAPEPEVLTPENIIEAAPLTPSETANAPVAPARPVETQTFTPPVQAPVVPSRPVQPAPSEVVSAPQAPAVNSAAAAPAAGSYFIQIASQPSAELAQKSFATMGQKYASIIGGRAVDIRKADIPNKGTYYRVRIAGGTKAEANALCERLKNAGGSCFVTQ